MMKKIFLSFNYFLGSFFVDAQSILNALSPESHIEALKRPKVEDLPYFLHIDENDIAFSRIIFEEIDLKENSNQVYYCYTNEINNPCKSLYQVLLEGIRNYKIKAYADDNFTLNLDLIALEKRLSKNELSEIGKEIFNQGKAPQSQHYDRYEIKSSDIEKFKIKGIWYFDRRIGEMSYKILALAPVGPDIYQMGEDLHDSLEKVTLFWVWYPGARELLDKAKTSIGYGSIKASFEELLSARKFTPLTSKENSSKKDLNQNDFGSKSKKLEKIEEEITQKAQQIWNP